MRVAAIASPIGLPDIRNRRLGMLMLRACFAGCESVGDFHRRGFLIQSAGWGWRPARMPRSYSLDLRERAVALVDDGRSRREVARLFKIGVSSVIRWCQRARPDHGQTGSDAPRYASRAGGTRHSSELQGGLELLSGREAELQKKACAPASKAAPTWRASARAGSGIRPRLTRNGSSSSTRPGSRRT